MRYRISIGVFLLLILVPAFTQAQEEYGEPSTLVSYRAALKGSPLDKQPPVASGDVMRLSLDDCLKFALRSNRKIRSGDYGISAAEAQEREAHALINPVFEYEYRSAPVPNDASRAVQTFFQGEWAWANQLKLGMGMPLYTFGKLATAAELAGKGIAAARERRIADEVLVTSRIRQIYYGIQLAEEMSALLIDAVDRLGNEIKKAEAQDTDSDLKASEKYSPIDKLRMKVYRAELEKRLAEARMKEELAINALKFQMGLPMTANVRPNLGLSPARVDMQDYQHYLRRMEELRPEAKLADIGVEAKKLEFRMTKRQMLPDLGLGAFFDIGRTVGTVKNVQTTDDYVNPFTYTRAGIGIRLQGKLDLNSSFAKIDRSESELYKASLERDAAKEGLALEVKEAYLRLKQTREQVARSEETKKMARQMVFLSKSNLDLGIGEKSEYVDALQVMLLSKTQYLEAVFSYNAAVVQLDEKIGYVPYDSGTVEYKINRTPRIKTKEISE
jgi:outer membrane protein TolC